MKPLVARQQQIPYIPKLPKITRISVRSSQKDVVYLVLYDIFGAWQLWTGIVCRAKHLQCFMDSKWVWNINGFFVF